MRKIIFIALLAALVATAGKGQQPNPPNSDDGLVVDSKSHVSIPSDHVQLVLKDDRVKAMLKFAKDAFGMTCAVSDANNVQGNITTKAPRSEKDGPPPPPDAIQTWYEFPVTCNGGGTLLINAQFAALDPGPQRITMTIEPRVPQPAK